MTILDRAARVQQQLDDAEARRTELLEQRAAIVRELRAQGFTQAEAGALLGISNQRVSQIERA